MKIRVSIVFFLLVAMTCAAQLKVDDQISIQEAITKLVGPGVRVSGVQINCPSSKSRPYGYFTDNTGSLDLPEGLILTTGSAKNAIGPNNSGSISQGNGNTNKDPDLSVIIANSEKQLDACVVEFNVEVFADTLVFDYVFGSDEYPEFIKDYHDVFGFFISGPGIPGMVNLALVPGTSDPVSVKNLNKTTNSQYFIENGTGSTPFDNLFVQYDGYTKKLESKIAVVPCQMYRLKLAICDVKDDIYDAGIFIGGKSLRTKAPIFSKRSQFPKFRTATEGCNGIFVTLTRQSRIETETSFQLEYSGTATQGLDYGSVPTQLDFAAGERSREFFIPILNDELPDDNEEIIVSVINPCPGLPEVDQLKIIIRETFDFDVPDFEICLGDSVNLNPAPPTGYQYNWFPPLFLSCTNCASPKSSPPENIRYYVQIQEDESGCKAFDSLEVKVKPIPIAAFDFESNSDYTNLDVFFTNQSQFADAWNWDFSDGSTSQEKDARHYFLSGFAMDTISYKVILTARNSEIGCSDTASVLIKIGNPLNIPNLITANGDEVNDSFFIKGIQPGKWSVEICDRWGQIVFQSNAYNLDWKGENVEPGIYFFRLQNQPGTRSFTGWIQLLK